MALHPGHRRTLHGGVRRRLEGEDVPPCGLPAPLAMGGVRSPPGVGTELHFPALAALRHTLVARHGAPAPRSVNPRIAATKVP